VIRFFNIEATDIVSYDPRVECWYLNGDHEGNMSVPLANLIMRGLSRAEVTAEDASAIWERSPRDPAKQEKRRT
jgi:hypothetical protein